MKRSIVLRSIKTKGEVRLDDNEIRISGARRVNVTGLGAREPLAEELASPISAESGNLGLNKAVIRWMSVKLRESLWLVRFVMLGGLPPVQQAAISNCLSFDRFPFYQDGLAPPKIDIGGRQVADALVVSQVIVVGDEGLDLGFKIAQQVIVLEQDAVLERLMPALDLSLGHRMIRRATDMLHVLAVEPFGQVRRDVAGAVAPSEGVW